MIEVAKIMPQRGKLFPGPILAHQRTTIHQSRRKKNLSSYNEERLGCIQVNSSIAVKTHHGQPKKAFNEALHTVSEGELLAIVVESLTVGKQA